MSSDFFIITPPDYDFERFIKRVPSYIDTYFNDDLGDYVLEDKAKDWHGWLAAWHYTDDGLDSLEEAFTPEQLEVIKQIDNPKFFIITAAGYDALYEISKLIADDPNILVLKQAIGENE